MFPVVFICVKLNEMQMAATVFWENKKWLYSNAIVSVCFTNLKVQVRINRTKEFEIVLVLCKICNKGN